MGRKQHSFTCVIFVILNYHLVNSRSPPRDDKDAHLSVPQLISKYGYPIQIHSVTTEDGYILTVHRIPYGKNSTGNGRRIPVILQHGTLSSSADWVIMGPEIALGYVLADAGFDVWLGNNRGNTYSRKHVSLNPDGKKFWQFSWHEMGVYDLPAMTDYVLKETGEEKLFCIGYSQSTRISFVMLSERPEYNDKVRAVIAMAPTVFMSHMKSPLVRLFAHVGTATRGLSELRGCSEVLPHSTILSRLGTIFCNGKAGTAHLCKDALFVIFGFDPDQLDTAMMPSILGHSPAGISSCQLQHNGQLVVSGKFRQFDHGIIGNMIKYKQPTPPEYSLGNVTTPVFLFHSDNDRLLDERDVNELFQKLRNPIGIHKVSYLKFNHIDYMWALNAPEYVYYYIVDLMKKY